MIRSSCYPLRNWATFTFGELGHFFCFTFQEFIFKEVRMMDLISCLNSQGQTAKILSKLPLVYLKVLLCEKSHLSREPSC